MRKLFKIQALGILPKACNTNRPNWRKNLSQKISSSPCIYLLLSLSAFFTPSNKSRITPIKKI
jgi:hypothetical protein